MKFWIITGLFLVVMWALRPSAPPAGLTLVRLPRGLADCVASRFRDPDHRVGLGTQLRLWAAAVNSGAGFEVSCGDRTWRVVVADEPGA